MQHKRGKDLYGKGGEVGGGGGEGGQCLFFFDLILSREVKNRLYQK